MIDDDAEVSSVSLFGAVTPQLIHAEFQRDFSELGYTPFELAERMASLGDRRPFETILRGVQRAISGESRVPGELKVLVRAFLRQHRRALERHKEIQWKLLLTGAYSAQISLFSATLLPESRGRWRVCLFDQQGYAFSWPRWQDNLEAAKIRAIIRAEDAIDELLEHQAFINST